jgi:hypothetical protein
LDRCPPTHHGSFGQVNVEQFRAGQIVSGHDDVSTVAAPRLQYAVALNRRWLHAEKQAHCGPPIGIAWGYARPAY